MRSIIKVFILFFAAFAVPQAAFALESLQNEIIYRTNLGRADDVQILIKQGADPNTKNGNGVPLLCLAASRKDSQARAVVRTLLDAGADIDIRDNLGQSALFYAVKKDNIEVVQFLLSKGINYYAIDNNGDIARNIAYKDGHKDIFEALDNFVKQQNDERNKQYEDLNKQIQQRYQEQEDNAKKQQEIFNDTVKKQHEQLIEQQKQAQQQLLDEHKKLQDQLDEQQKKLEALKAENAAQQSPTESPEDGTATPDVATPTPEPAKESPAASPASSTSPSPEASKPDAKPMSAADKKKADEAKKEADAKKAEEMKKAQADLEETRQELIAEMGKDLSFKNCAFQYWYFCRAIKQSTELSPEELDMAVDGPKATILALESKMQDELKLKKDYVRNVSESSKQRIFNELNTMPSNSYRHEFGVGKMDDMQTRCSDISRQWDAAKPGVADVSKNNDGYEGNGGLGGSGGSGKKGGANAGSKHHKSVAPKDAKYPNGKGAHKAYGTPATSSATPAGKPGQMQQQQQQQGQERRGGAYQQ